MILTEGELEVPWSPHPSEVYDGITTIDKDGITVTASNVKSKTNMSANGFKITKTDTNEDVFKVNSDGTLSIKGKIEVGSSVPTGVLSGVVGDANLSTAIKNGASAGTFKVNSDGTLSIKGKIEVGSSVPTGVLSGVVGDANLSTAIKNGASAGTSAQTTLNNKASGWDTAKKTVDDNKTNWSNAYNRVAQWAYGAVNESTTIDGGLIQTNTILADKIAIGDFTNYCEMNEYNCDKFGFTKVVDSTQPSNPWLKANSLARDICINSTRNYETYRGNVAGTYRVEFEVKSTVKGATSSGGSTIAPISINVGLYCKRKDGTNTWPSTGIGYSTSDLGQVKKVSGTIKVESDVSTFGVYIQCAGWTPFSGELYIRNIRITKMATGELIVDGAITTDKIHTNGLNASVIKAGTIDAARLDANVIASKVNGATTLISGDKIQTGTLSASKITTGTLDATKVTVINLNASNITSGTINSDRLNVSTLVSKINSGSTTISGDKITTGTITTSHIHTNGLNASVIKAGTISADRINADTLRGKTITGGTISGGTVSGATITGGRIDINNGVYKVSSSGNTKIGGDSAVNTDNTKIG